LKYSTFDRELLAVFLAIRYFRFMLEGRHFTIYTDHKPLVGALHRVSEPWSARQQRQLSFISEFTADIRHTPGAANAVADALSRPATTAGITAEAPQPAQPSPVDLTAVAADQEGCPDCSTAETSPALRVMRVLLPGPSSAGISILVDASSGVLRPLVPRQHRRHVFDAIHSLAHPGVRATRRLISSRFVWPRLADDIKRWCGSCQACAAAKVTKQHTAAPQAIAVPTTRFSHIHVDLVGPLPAAADGSAHLLTAVDRSTRWAEAFPLQSATAESCLAALTAGWFSRFGLPSIITTDRGVQFTAAAWGAALKRLGIHHVQTTAYHPQSNGAVERFHRRLKDALKARLAGPSWPLHLPWVLLGLRATPREDSNVSPAELVFGSPLNLPAAVVTAEQPPEAFMQQLSSFIPCVAPLDLPLSSPLPPALAAAKHVYVRSPPAAPALSPAYRGPYRVLGRGEKFFKVVIGNRIESLSVDRLKPHAGDSPVLASPPRRGRPPLQHP
jgi:transposase InsO family protein